MCKPFSSASSKKIYVECYKVRVEGVTGWTRGEVEDPLDLKNKSAEAC